MVCELRLAKEHYKDAEEAELRVNSPTGSTTFDCW